MINNEPLHQQRLYQLIILLAGILIAGSAIFFLRDFQTQTNSVTRELLGVDYVQKLQETMFEAQRVRGLYEVLRNGDLGADGPYTEANAHLHEKFKLLLADEHGMELGISHQLNKLQAAFQKLQDDLSHTSDPTAFQRFTHHIETFRDMLLQIANRSHLALETDIATYYLADLSTNHLPSVVEAIGRLRGIGAGVITSGKYSRGEIRQLDREIEAVRLELAHVARKLHAVFALNPKIKSLMPERFTNIDQRVEKFISSARSIIDTETSEIDALSFFSQGTQAAGICTVICGNVRDVLKEMLHKRIIELRQQTILVAAGLSSAITLMAVLAVVFYRREHKLVQMLMDETNFSSALVDGLPSLFFLIDISGRFRRWNHEFERISGYSSAEIAELHASDLVVRKQRSALKNAMSSVFKGGAAKSEFNVLTKSSKEIPVYATGLRVELENQPYIAGFAQDITERKQMEESALRYQRKFSIIAIDIDHFKRVNDTHGHSTGDDVLKEVVNIIHLQIRHLDGIYRYGGEEFNVILPETNLQGAILQAERLRNAIAEHHFKHIGKMTISLGVAEYRQEEAIHILLKRADDSLYAAKVAGRNQVDIGTA